MLISPVTEDENAIKEGRGDHVDATGHLHEYQTASDLFDLMASSNYYGAEGGEDKTFSTRDLVLIYKNIDLGSKLMSNPNEFKRRAPNQYVETIVYEDFDSDTDLGEICSSEDIHNLMLINQERINLLTTSGIETTICNKFNYIDSSTSNLTVDYDRKLSYQNFYKKDQIIMNTNDLDKPVLPASLLDYINCKYFEDNYNFDMDNIVRYIKHTIDQLKRISNGDYLTEKVKEKWREVDSDVRNKPGEMIEAETLAVSVPLYVERKVTGDKWDDVIHSSINIKSISKILEKKIIFEVPKTLCGSYTLFSKCCNDNLIIRCQKRLPELVAKEMNQEPRVNMVLQLNGSESGHILSNINTIMILKSEKPTEFLPLLTYDSSENCNTPEEKVTEVVNYNRNSIHLDKLKDALGKKKYLAESVLNLPGCSEIEFSDYNISVPADSGYQTSGTVSNYEEHFKIVNSDTESHIKKRLNMSSLPEESIEESSSKKRSPTRNRIKSPYENKSHVVEERRRKKLLEVKQRREKNKLALSVNSCKVKKIKYPIPPQTANSVTKLSISNKSFYNSIYGQNANMERKPSKTKIRKETRDSIPEVPSDTNITTPILAPDCPDRQSEKYINKSYYLDNAETEMMYTEMKKNDSENLESMSTNDIKMELNLLSDLISPSIVGLTASELANKWPESDFNNVDEKEEKVEINKSSTLPSSDPTNTPNNSPMGTKVTTSEREFEEKDPKKEKPPDDFIKSIDKIYELIHKLGKQDNDTKLCKSKFTAVGERAHYNDVVAETSTAQYSDSGTSVKHQLTSSNPSSYSFEKAPKVEETPRTDSPSDSISPKKRIMPVVSKVVISAKSQTYNGEKSTKDFKRAGPNNKQNTTENPLIAISKLLQDFDNVQKNRNKIITQKNPRKPEVTFADTKPDSRVFVKKPLKIDQQVEKQMKVAPRERRYRLPITAQQQTLAENKPGLRGPKKKVVDIDDEIKEARGEAVRGPCKLNARLNSLAQPKKIYVQAQIEEFQARYGKSIVTDRLQKLSGMPTGQSVDHLHPISPKQRKIRNSPEALSITSKQTPNAHPAAIEKPLKRTFNRRETFPNDQSSKQIVIPHDVFKKKIAAASTESTERCSIRSSDKESLPRTSNKESSLLNSSKERVNVAYKSRIPYVPNDLELVSIDSSVEGSSAIRGKIHHMINTIIPTQSFNKKTVHNTDLIVVEDTTAEHNLRRPQHQRLLKIKCEQNIGDSIPEQNDQIEEPSLNLEKSLCQISAGTFQKHINHTKIKLTPKNSMQKVLLLQSGDSNSVLLQSTIPQNIKFMKTNNEADCLPVLSNLDWNFTKFPVQMPIVAYSFPKIKINNPYSSPAHSETVNRKDSETNKTTQCYKGIHVDLEDQVSQVDIKEYLTFSSLFKMSPTVIKEEEPEEMKSVSNYEIEKLETDHDTESENGNNVTETNMSVVDEETKISNNVNIKKSAVVIVKQCAKESGNYMNSSEKCDPNGECDDIASKNHNINTSERCNNMYEPEAGDAKISGECNIHAQEEHSIKDKCDIGASGEKNIKELEGDIKASEECINKVSSMTSSMDTSSLDVLVGLLNEIQKITSCQNQMARSDVDDKEKHSDIETILKSTSLDNVERESRNIISMTSLDKLRHLESHASILSFYLSNIDDKDMIDNGITDLNLTPLYADKGISAVMTADNVSKCTNAPSLFFPLTVNHSTNISNSLIGVLSEPSSHSLFSYNELPLRSNKSLTCLTKVIDIPKIYEEDKHDQASIVVVKRPIGDGHRKQRINKEKPINAEEQKVVIYRKNMSKKYALESDFDPVMKMKRDILVTMYSVLVLTVFAALSFPQMLYRA